ncbi:rust resistance kinase Lr10-like isoform X1 [Iris pallida]|uniref:Rust resistance kinase Lr10-like isoform X1 n=1 Tax=Iris pallida TaxID=29817 RepID=A0AAX6DP31_IRIPA|nr:rust resistance kinase Lr10-like isoform X1 [Iris pallida]
MTTTRSPNISASSLTLLLLLSVAVAVAAAAAVVERKEGCSPSSCGPVQVISYPFRLKDDPIHCGDPNYEITCNSNNLPLLQISSSNYFVSHISYENATIRVVGAGFATSSGGCSGGSPALSSYPQSAYYKVVDRSVATFVNCSEEVQKDKYRPIPCLSRNRSFVYVTSGPSVGDVAPSCSFSSMVPTPYDVTSRGVDVFRALQEGFSLNWTPVRMTTSKFIRGCLKEAERYYPWEERRRKSMITWVIYPFQIEKELLDCMNPNSYITDSSTPYVPSSVMYRLMVALIVSIDVAALLTVIALLGRFIFAPLSVCAFLAYDLWKLLVPVDIVEKFLQKHQTLAPTRYSYTDIVAMTGHFKEKLGQGGFGAVFKGRLPGGFQVAVKILSSSKCVDGEDFISEVSTLGTIHHLNVVGLVGFCSEGPRRALVYEFMPNGSLDKYIFPSSSGTGRRFTREKLNEIALGVARGIDYLHRGCDARILHFDIKPHNVLLDRNLNPKVSDFGLAKLYPKDYSVVSACAARGTIGYMAPELVSRTFGLVSYKSDVYSFGMLLMEMAGGRRNVDVRAEDSSRAYYPSWIYDQLEQRERAEKLEIIGGGAGAAVRIDDVETKLSKVGLWCIQMRSSDRPSMSEVVEMLEADGDTLAMPPKPFSDASRTITLRQSCNIGSSAATELSVISERSDDTISPPSE